MSQEMKVVTNEDKILYPEHAKLRSENHKTEIIHSFLDWCSSEYGAILVVEKDGMPLNHVISHDKMLAKYIDVNLDTLEQEKRDMLDSMRATHREEDIKKASN